MIKLPGIIGGTGGTGGNGSGENNGGGGSGTRGTPSDPNPVITVASDDASRATIVSGEFDVPASQQNEILLVAGPARAIPASGESVTDQLQPTLVGPAGAASNQEVNAATPPAPGAGIAAEVSSDDRLIDQESGKDLLQFQAAGMAPLADFFPAALDALENAARGSLTTCAIHGEGGQLGAIASPIAFSLPAAVALEAGYRQLKSNKPTAIGAMLWAGPSPV